MIMVIDNAGRRLCKDKRWRDFANFGTYPECVKVYKRVGNATRVAKRFGGQVVVIHSDESVKRLVNASGQVEEHRPIADMPNFVTSLTVPIHDFVI